MLTYVSCRSPISGALDEQMKLLYTSWRHRCSFSCHSLSSWFLDYRPYDACVLFHTHPHLTSATNASGYYAGYVSSAFMVGRVGSSYFWGRFADRHGRLPVIYMGLISMVVLSIAFGLSTSLLWALGCR